jgi:hypothetical protein
VIRDLEIARERFDADEDGYGRLGVLTAIDVFNRLGTVLLPNRAAELLAPMRSLQHALIDAEQGKTHPLFTPKQLSARPLDRTEHRGLAGIAAVLMQLQMDAGKSKQDAARQVARRLDRLGYRTSQGKTISLNRVIGWRRRATTERVTEDIVAERYVGMLSQMRIEFPGNPTEAFEQILKNLPQALPVESLRPEKCD